MAKTSGSSPAVRRKFLANISAWVMQELEHCREIDEIAADVRMNRYQLTKLAVMSGLGPRDSQDARAYVVHKRLLA